MRWALGDGQEHGDDPAWDVAESVTLYERLEQEIILEFSARDKGGNPGRQEMKRIRQDAGATGSTVYSAAVSATRPRRSDNGYAIIIPGRVTPHSTCTVARIILVELKMKGSV